MKIVYAEIINGQITLPPEVWPVLPASGKLCVLVDEEKGRITIHAKDPTILPNKWYFDEMAAEMADVDWREYYDGQPPFEPVDKTEANSDGEK